MTEPPLAPAATLDDHETPSGHDDGGPSQPGIQPGQPEKNLGDYDREPKMGQIKSRAVSRLFQSGFGFHSGRRRDIIDTPRYDDVKHTTMGTCDHGDHAIELSISQTRYAEPASRAARCFAVFQTIA